VVRTEFLYSEGFQSRQKVKYGHKFRANRSQESLCWRGPTATQSVLNGLMNNELEIISWPNFSYLLKRLRKTMKYLTLAGDPTDIHIGHLSGYVSGTRVSKLTVQERLNTKQNIKVVPFSSFSRSPVLVAFL
jgi:hypothetical protein